MLKTTGSTKSAANPKETSGEANGNNMVGHSVIDDSKVANQIKFTKRNNLAKMTNSKILVKSKNRDFLLNFRNMKAG